MPVKAWPGVSTASVGTIVSMTGSTCARSGEKGDPAWRRSIQSKREAPPATRLVGAWSGWLNGS